MQIVLESGPDIRLARRSRNVSLNRFAVLMKVPQEALRAIERGEVEIHPDTLDRARRALEKVERSRLKTAALIRR